MSVEIKFCGLTRPADAALAAACGATYIGVIFAGGPRARDARTARAVLDGAPGVRRVGVVGRQSADEIRALVDVAGLDVIQLHADPTPAQIETVRQVTGCEVWGVLRVEGVAIPPLAGAVAAVADAILIEPRVPGQLGGTGVALDWARVADTIAPWRGPRRIVLAGGLTPINVKEAVDALAPAVVDVSSGVESAPGVKDPLLMHAFAKAIVG